MKIRIDTNIPSFKKEGKAKLEDLSVKELDIIQDLIKAEILDRKENLKKI